MNRVLIYSTEQLRLYDLLELAKRPLVSEGYVVADLLGLSSSNMVAGFAPTYNSNLTITLGTGRLYTLQVVDATIYGGTPGGLAADSNIIAQSAENAIQTLTFSTASLSSGQALYALVEVSYAQNDVIEASDPTSGLLTYLNPGNPTVPWIGPNNTGVTQPTTRAAQAVLTIKYGSPATSGAQVPPTVDAGNVPLYLVTLSFGQTSITSANVVVAGPSAAVNVPSNYPSAPFIAGLLNSHHSGTPGQAPQIKLTSEVQGTLPLVNLPAVGTIGLLPTVQVYAGNPNTNVAGFAQAFVWDSTHKVLWECTVPGSAASAVWTAVSHKTLNNILDDGSGNVTINGTTMNIGASSSSTINISAPAATNRQVFFQTVGVDRWAILANNVTESGSNAGSDLNIISYSDAGTSLNIPITAIRATGEIHGGGGVPVGVTGISGLSTVMLDVPVLLGSLTSDNAVHSISIGTTYANAKIAILKVLAQVVSTGSWLANISFGRNASSVDSSLFSKLNYVWQGTGGSAALSDMREILVGLTTGSNPSFSYQANVSNSGGVVYLVGFIQ